MQNDSSPKDKGSDFLAYMAEKKQTNKEKIVQHSPPKPKPKWQYSLREGGPKYTANIPATQEQIAKVKSQVWNPHNWRQYVRSPFGGDRNYTSVTCFPPFEAMAVAEIFFPSGEVWNSRKRTIIKTIEE